MILAVRHGERGDRSSSPLERDRVELYFDPHLTEIGAKQAELTGLEITTRLAAYEQELRNRGLSSGKKIKPVILVSPFLRTIQTAYHLAKNLENVYENSIFVQEELSELLWDQQEFDIDPIPRLFSKTRKLEKFKNYGLDFIDSDLKLQKSLFSDPAFIKPKYPEQKEECIKRVWTFIDMLPLLFFEKFPSNEYALIWVSHQFTLACAVWFYEDLTPEVFPDSNIEYCGIVDCRFENIGTKDLNYKVRQLGTSPHLNK